MGDLPAVNVSQLGGDVAVDLFNTVDWRLDPARWHERLTSYRHVLTWMRTQKLLTGDAAALLAGQADERPDAAASEHARILQLRDDTYVALTECERPLALESSLREARAHSHLAHADDRGWRWEPDAVDLAAPRYRLALELERLMQSDAMRWFHRCEDDHCGWVFLDTSRQHNRRWCSSADCGNRNRVRAHYARTRADAG